MKSASRRVAGELWIVLAKIAPPAGWSTPQSSWIAFEVSAILWPPSAPQPAALNRRWTSSWTS